MGISASKLISEIRLKFPERTRLLAAHNHLLGKLSAPVLLCLLLGAPLFAFAECALIGSIPAQARSLYSSALDSSHGRLVAIHEEGQVRVIEITREPSFAITTKLTIPIQPGVEISPSFVEGNIVISQWRRVISNGDNQTPLELAEIKTFNLSDGLPSPLRTFSVSSESILPPKSNEAPFYSSTWPYRSWQEQLCTPATTPNAQQGRIAAALGNFIFVAHAGEQLNYCNPNPDYYRFHLNPSTGAPLGPILPAEHCPTCAFWWTRSDPGIKVYSGTGAPTLTETARHNFPPLLFVPNPGESAPLSIPTGAIIIKSINAVRPDPFGTGFAMSVDLTTALGHVQDVGGVLFFNHIGEFIDANTTPFSGSRLGENGALAPIGSIGLNSTLYIVGSPRNVSWPAIPGGEGIPQKPEAGHVEYMDSQGALHNIEFGGRADDLFGTSVAGLGDLNRDAIPDALIGAPGGAYASISSSLPHPETEAYGSMYVFKESGTAPGYGKLVASAAGLLPGRVDTAIVASNEELFFYDLTSCGPGLRPLMNGRALLRDLAPKALEQAERINPNPRGRPPRIPTKLNPVHPNTRVVSTLVTRVSEALRTDSELLPSNEEIRAADMNRAVRALNLSSNVRDFNYYQIRSLQQRIRQLERACPPRVRRRIRPPPPRACGQLKLATRKLRLFIEERNFAISQVTFAKQIILDNLHQILAELRELP